MARNPHEREDMRKVTIQKFDTGMGQIEAHLVKETDDKLKDHRQEYVEVYNAGQVDPYHMIAWFGTVASFARWISGANIQDF